MFFSKILGLSKKPRVTEKSDVFDNRFGFILKHKIDTKENYKMVKAHFFNRSLKTS